MSHSSSSEVRISTSQAGQPVDRRTGCACGGRAASGRSNRRFRIGCRFRWHRALGRAHPFELGKLLAGERLGHFELLEYVGGGGMGAVFRARDTMLGREVALKVLSRDRGPTTRRAAASTSRPNRRPGSTIENIARVYYVGEDQGLNFIVFEFIRGENVRDLVERQGALPLRDAVSFTLQIAEAWPMPASRERGPSRYQAVEHHRHQPKGGRSWSIWAWRGCTSEPPTTT